MAQEDLDRAQVRARLEEVRRARVPQRVGLTRRSMPAAFAAKRTASQMHLEVSGLSARQPLLAWEEGTSAAASTGSIAQRREQRRARGHLARGRLPALDAEHHALAVDVRDFQLQELTCRRPAPERHQHRAVVEILRAGNQRRTSWDSGLGAADGASGWAVLLQLAPLEHPHKEEAQGGDVEPTVPTASFFHETGGRDSAEAPRRRADRGDVRGGSARRCGSACR